MNSVWQQILAAIDTRLKGILISSGYQTDAGKNVFYWRTIPFAQDSEGTMSDLPGIKYFETSERTETLNFPIRTNTTSLSVECLATGSDDATVKATIDKIYADVMKAFGTDETWGGLAIITEKTGHEVKMEREEVLVGALSVTFEITYRHSRWDVSAAR